MHPGPHVESAGQYQLHPDSLVKDSLDKIFGSLEQKYQTTFSPLRTGFVRIGVSLGLPLLWLALSLRNLVHRQRPAELPDRYVLFLPNLNQNLASMTAVCSGLRDVPVVFCCPHTVSRDTLSGLLDRQHSGNREIISLHWVDFVKFGMMFEYFRLGRSLLACYAAADRNVFRLIMDICKYSLYGILCLRMREIAFSGILARPPAVIISARPKSHYGNLPFLHAASTRGIPAYFLSHSHIDASRHFQYQVFRAGLFRACFLFSTACKRIAEQHFRVDCELIVTGDPVLDKELSRMPDTAGQRAEKEKFRVMYAASTFYGQDSMRDLADIIGSMPDVTLAIKTRPPGHNSDEIRKHLKGINAGKVSILDHAETGPIEEILGQADLVIGCATNSVINAVLRGVPAVVYINTRDEEKIKQRSMQRLPYEEFGIPVVHGKEELRRLLVQLKDDMHRKELLENQMNMAGSMYPNLHGSPAVDVIGSYVRPWVYDNT